jgi:peptidyl-prolyl cis-trans isomerase D
MGDLAFSLKPGEVGGPVRSAYGFHIIKAEEIKPAALKPFDTVKGQVKRDLIQEESSGMALDAAEEFYDSLALGTELKKAAAEFGYEVKEATAVRGRPVKGLGAAPELVAAIFDAEPGELTPLFEAQGKRVLAQLKKVARSRLPELKEVKERAEAGHNALEGRRLALDAARKMRGDLAKTKDFALTADRANVKAGEKGPFTREEGLLGISKDPELIDSVFALTGKSPIPGKVMTAGGKFYVFALKREIPASEKEFEENKEELIARYTDAKRRLRFEEFIAMLRERAEIEILQDL